jgi:hypothetical protein
MGYGDELMASGFARGAKHRGKRIAFGDRTRIIWGPWCKEVFKNNPNIAPPGSERAKDIEWVEFYKGKRTYHLGVTPTHWIYNMEFRASPGEIYFDELEQLAIDHVQLPSDGFVMIEPNTPPEKPQCVNKQWPYERFQAIADLLRSRGIAVAQLVYPKARYHIEGAHHVTTRDFRSACGVLSRAALFIGGEGGMHHAAAALSIPAVVLFGGYTPVELTGYELHANLAGNSVEACGSLQRCQHCLDALDSISVEEVFYYTMEKLGEHGDGKEQ